MKKFVIVAVIALIFIGGGISSFVILRSGANTTAPTASSGTYPVINACDILTETIATNVLGADINKGDTTGSSAESNDIAVSNCLYSTKVTSTGKQDGVSILVRSAKTKTGSDNNIDQFSEIPTGSEIITGIGDKAFFNPQFKQLNVLKGGNWYIITYYKTAIGNSSLALDKVLAQKLHYK